MERRILSANPCARTKKENLQDLAGWREVLAFRKQSSAKQIHDPDQGGVFLCGLKL